MARQVFFQLEVCQNGGIYADLVGGYITNDDFREFIEQFTGDAVAYPGKADRLRMRHVVQDVVDSNSASLKFLAEGQHSFALNLDTHVITEVDDRDDSGMAATILTNAIRRESLRSDSTTYQNRSTAYIIIIVVLLLAFISIKTHPFIAH